MGSSVTWSRPWAGRASRQPWSTHARSATSPAPPACLAKTDRLDARILALFAERMRPPPRLPGSEADALLVGLVLRRRQLVVLRDAERSRRRRIGEPELLRSLDDHLARLTAEIERIETAMAARLEALAATRDRAALLTSVPGIGALTAASLLAR